MQVTNSPRQAPLGLLSADDYPNCASALAVPATLLPHRLSRSMALQAIRDNVQFLQGTLREPGRVLEQLGVVMVAQPEDQLAFEVGTVFNAELSAALRPPFVNAAVANQFASIEEGTGIRAAQELLTVGTGIDTKQAEGVLQPFQVELVARQYLVDAWVGFFRHGSAPGSKSVRVQDTHENAGVAMAARVFPDPGEIGW